MGVVNIGIRLAKLVNAYAVLREPRLGDIPAVAKQLLDELGEHDERYLANRGLRCPKCGSMMEVTDALDADGDTATANVTCEKCDFTGVELWELVGIEEEK